MASTITSGIKVIPHGWCSVCRDRYAQATPFYRILGEIGVGTYSRVKLAEDTSTHEKVRVNILLLEAADMVQICTYA